MKYLIYTLFILLFIASSAVGVVYFIQPTPSFLLKFFNKTKTALVEAPVVDHIAPIILKQPLLKTPCQKTLYYSLGELDKRHNLTPAKFRLIMNNAENIWESEFDYNLFEYKEGAAFKINFVFDERQQMTISSKKLDANLSTLKTSQGDISTKHDDITDEYDDLQKDYEDDANDLKDKVSDYNKTIAGWNEKGSITPNENKKLEKEYEDIQDDQEDLEDLYKKIKKLVKKANSLASKEQILIDSYNTTVNTYRSEFGSSRKFNQGEYFGTGITIYQFKYDSDLTLALAHELGHALTLDHVENPKSVMYYLMDAQNLNNIKLTEDDISALNIVCNITSK